MVRIMKNSEQVEQYANELLMKMYSNDKALLAIKEILKFSDNKHKESLLKVQELLIKWTKQR
jgi:hypothetical protein